MMDWSPIANFAIWETDENLRERIRYVSGVLPTAHGDALDEIAERYNLKRRYVTA